MERVASSWIGVPMSYPRGPAISLYTKLLVALAGLYVPRDR